MQLEDWLDDLCVRFIINLPPEELESVERICFQVEEAQWFYEDFIRPLDPSLPSLSLRAFSLRIFQHCPLFSQWSAQHHTTAFAEFLAYKSRVPVRGAIMLNNAMDEVVLVKGWKKSANWSFPRGKINKDENDLDCAVREVYEETGFDIRAAGLVGEEKFMKYIEVTMREQHMRLYVFRGVPRDTHFEPKTRKEISKIEWYKLTDLPTLKKNRQQEGSGTDQPALNANKFYMVAPFLNPLKKWIAQQRKKENRYSSHLAAPPMVVEEGTTEDDLDSNGLAEKWLPPGQQPVSDLPEVSAPLAVDPAGHLKNLLHVGPLRPPHAEASAPTNHMARVDTEKSSALLALLRSGSQPEPRVMPHTPLEQVTTEPALPRSPHVSHVRLLPPPLGAPASGREGPRSGSPIAQAPGPFEPHAPRQLAPYQQTGDPQFATPGHTQGQTIVPPAAALPTLTNHTKALLDVFKGFSGNATPLKPLSSPGMWNIPSVVTAKPPPAPQTQHSLEPVTRSTGQQPSGLTPQLGHGSEEIPESTSSTRTGRRPVTAQQTSLLHLFSNPRQPPAALAPVQKAPPAPAELAATGFTASSRNPPSEKEELLLGLFGRGTQRAPRKVDVDRPSPREGETAATINGPLNQPEFEAIARSGRQVSELRRSPLATNRKLYDPNQPAPVKILTRPDEERQQSSRSPRPLKAPPKRGGREKPTPKAPTKAFQPQILRRPQTSEPGTATNQEIVSDRERASDEPTVLANVPLVASPAPARVASADGQMPGRQASQSDAQKQTLLSLFGSRLDTTPKARAPPTSSGIVSPLTTSQLMQFNSGGEVPLSGIDPISTRTSRVGSLASMGSGPGMSRGTNEKRQTGAENKAFLLGYLGRIASQEGHQ